MEPVSRLISLLLLKTLESLPPSPFLFRKRDEVFPGFPHSGLQMMPQTFKVPPAWESTP